MFTSRKYLVMSLVLFGVLSAALLSVFLFETTRVSPGCSQVFDLIISGAEVIDGSGKPAFRADVGIKNQRIACVGNLANAKSQRTIDANGLTVAPGFIDVHTHV